MLFSFSNENDWLERSLILHRFIAILSLPVTLRKTIFPINQQVVIYGGFCLKFDLPHNIAENDSVYFYSKTNGPQN